MAGYLSPDTFAAGVSGDNAQAMPSDTSFACGRTRVRAAGYLLRQDARAAAGHRQGVARVASEGLSVLLCSCALLHLQNTARAWPGAGAGAVSLSLMDVLVLRNNTSQFKLQLYRGFKACMPCYFVLNVVQHGRGRRAMGEAQWTLDHMSRRYMLWLHNSRAITERRWCGV